jgi:hypothetical protein
MLIPMLMMPQDSSNSDGTSPSCTLANNMALNMGMNMSMMGQPMPFMITPQPFPHIDRRHNGGAGQGQGSQKPASTTPDSKITGQDEAQSSTSPSTPPLEAMQQAQAQQIQAAMQMQAMQMAFAQSTQNGGFPGTTFQPMWAPAASFAAPPGTAAGTRTHSGTDQLLRRPSDATASSEKSTHNNGANGSPSLSSTPSRAGNSCHNGRNGSGGNGHSSANGSSGNLAHAA